MPGERLVLGVGEFVDYLNQAMEMAFPYVEVQGELANFRVSKNKWVYFDLKDEAASVRCFATVYTLPGPLEDGMLVRVAGTPRLHPQYSFTFTVQAIVPVGEGELRRAADLLAKKLEGEGLFDPARKRPLPFPPQRIALVTAGDSAAYADFVKVSGARWGGLQLQHYNVLVQGDNAPGQIVSAIQRANQQTELADVLVLIRGGGSADDLAAFSDERVVRAVAASRIPTLVAIGHEIDTSLAELAADMRASTPSNAAELLVPDRHDELRHLRLRMAELDESLRDIVSVKQAVVDELASQLDATLRERASAARGSLTQFSQLLDAYNPRRPLRQGYALVHGEHGLITKAGQLSSRERVRLEFARDEATAQIDTIRKKGTHA